MARNQKHSLKLTEHLKIGLPSTKVVFQSSIFRCKLALSFRERRHLPLRLFFCSKGCHQTIPQRKVPNSASSTFRPYENRLEERSTCESHDFRVFRDPAHWLGNCCWGLRKKNGWPQRNWRRRFINYRSFFLVRILLQTPRAKDTTLMDKSTLAGKARFSVEVFLVR